MVLFPLDSTRIRAYGWEVQSKSEDPRMGRFGLLQLEFHDGARWYYFRVPEAVFDAFMMARSKGSFFAQHIQRSYKSLPADEVEREQTGQ